jgi:uncharacterized protein
MSYSFLDLAHDVLKQSPQPLTFQEIWRIGQDRKFAEKVGTSGKTPWNSLGAQLYVDVRDNEASQFVKVGNRPARFFLRERQSEVTADAIGKLDKKEAEKHESKTSYQEKDLHPLLTYFAYAHPSFNRGRSIFTKTIHHQKSAKTGYSEWLHPDMVGFYLPLEDWAPDVIEFNKLADNNSLKLFSFELKKSLNKGNYRESYFQAVSNSSWAHEGYLVAADVLPDDDFLAELERLAAAFGIGIIQLDLADISSSTILYPARAKNNLDWEMINKLCEYNADFKRFLQDVKIDFESRRIHRTEYDPIISDIGGYVREKLKIG